MTLPKGRKGWSALCRCWCVRRYLGLENGYALMFGGSKQAVGQIEPAIRVLAQGPLATLRSGV